MTIGPTLPPHLAKRSREDDGGSASSPESSDKRRRVIGPAPPPTTNSPPRVVGPSLPPQMRSRSISEDSDAGPATPQPARVLGPALPPAPLDERPPNPPSDNSDSSDDDFGPAPPPPGSASASYDHHVPAARSAFDTDPQYTEAPKRVQRDEWMTMPPTQDDLGRLDPSKLRARKFNTGKSAISAGTEGAMGVWTETPEQKLKRLQDEAMGITAPANSSASNSSKKGSERARKEEEKAQKLREKLQASRGKSLVEQHKEKSGTEEEDDPSKRGFNYEKDMAIGAKISHKQKREMLAKAKDFNGRFSSGSFL